MTEGSGRSPSGRAAAANAVEPEVSSKASIPNAVAELRCDVCGEPAIGVASSSVGPMSQAYCRSCAGQSVLSDFEACYLYDFVSSDGEGLAEWVTTSRVRKGDGWLNWADYVAERHQGPFCEAHQTHHLPSGCSLCAYEADTAASAIEGFAEDTEEWLHPEGESAASKAGDAQ